VKTELDPQNVTLPVLSSADIPASPSELRPILDLSTLELADWLKAQGYPAFRTQQVRRWLIQRRINTFDQMSDLPLILRRQLSEQFRFCSFETVGHQIASDRTEKLLLQIGRAHV